MRWYVYGLIDPRGCRIFYVGMTHNMRERLSQHSSCRESAAWQTIQEIKRDKVKVIMCEFAVFGSEESARLLESHLISCIPNILNRTHIGVREAFLKEIDCREPIGEVDADGSVRLSEEEFLQVDIAHLSDSEVDDGFVVGGFA